MKNKILGILLCLLTFFIIGCNSNKGDLLYIKMDEKVYINDEAKVNVYTKGELVPWKYLDYTISDYRIGEIRDGIFYPSDYGICQITVISKNNPKVYTSIEIEVIQPVVTDIIVTGDREVQVDKKIKLDVKVVPEIIKSEVIWEVEDYDIIDCNNGVITGVSVGKSKVILKCDDFVKEVEITVLPEPTSIEITGKNEISIGEVTYFNYNINEDIILASSNSNVVKVYDKCVYGVSKGKATITAFRNDKPNIKGTIEIEVKEDNNVGYISDSEKKIINEKLDKMTLEQMIGEMFMVGFTSDYNWYGYTTDCDIATGLPYVSFGTRYGSIIDYIKDYPIGNFMVNSYNGQNKETFFKSIKTLSEIGFNNTGINPYIGLNLHDGNEINCLNSIPSNYAIASSKSSDSVYNITSLYGKELNSYGVNLLINNYLNYNDWFNNKYNTYGVNIKKASTISYLVNESLKENKIKCVPSFGVNRWRFDERDVLDIYNNDYTLLKNNIINGCDVVSIPFTIYEDIKDDTYTYIDKEYMIDFLRGKLNYKGVLMADDMNLDYLADNGSLNRFFIDAINLGLDLINFEIIFTGSKNSAPYFKSRAQRLINLYNGIVEAVNLGDISKERIREANERILLSKLRNNTLLKTNNNENFDFDLSKELISEITPNFISVIGNMGVLDTKKSTIFISEPPTVTNTEKSAGEYFKEYFNKTGYKNITLYHTHRLDPLEVVEKAKVTENIYVLISSSNQYTMVGMGKDTRLFDLLQNLKKINSNICVILVGPTECKKDLNFINNFIITYNYYESDFQNVLKLLAGEVDGNNNYIE